MPPSGFLDKLQARTRATGAVLCIGLDPDLEKLPRAVASARMPLYEFCRKVVTATAPCACAFKPNLAFFEALGSGGIAQLEQLLGDMPSDVPVILDAKRSDIGNTARHYARFLFEHLKGDAATVSPYLGRDSLEPFFEYDGRLPFVLCLTSNPGSADIQTVATDGQRVYHRIIDLLGRLGRPFGLVVGARHAALLADVRRHAPFAPLLIPGIGAQGGDLSETLPLAVAGGAHALVNVSRDILYASGGDDFAEAAADKARAYVAEMQRILAVTRPPGGK